MSKTHKSLSSISKILKIHPSKLFKVVSAAGWILRKDNEWKVTPLGRLRGAEVKSHVDSSKGTYIVWPTSVIPEIELLLAKKFGTSNSESQRTDSKVPIQSKQVKINPNRINNNFRQKFRNNAKYRAQDGHYVRSKAELLIDNWLHQHAILHEYEKKVPVVEEVYCDFYLTDKNVYVEYWGYEKNAKYAQRMEAKRTIYRQNGLTLLEVVEEDMNHLDDVLSTKLLDVGYLSNETLVDSNLGSSSTQGLITKLKSFFKG